MEPIRYTPTFFTAHEFVPSAIYQEFGEQSWRFIDARMLWTMDAMRIYFNRPITVNNWHVGGDFEGRGFRPPYSSIGSPLGQHRFGRAVDFDVSAVSADEVRAVILSGDTLDLNRYVTAVELGVRWVHIDCRNGGGLKIFTFNAGGS